MGIHTSIYRERVIRPWNTDKYSIKLFREKKEIGLENPVSIREEFYLGKSTWAINEWLRKTVSRNYSEEEIKDLTYEWIDEKYIYIDELEKLLNVVEKVLNNHKLAKKLLPVPNNLKLVRPKQRCYDKELKAYVTKTGEDLEKVPRAEMYYEWYFEDLERASGILKKIISEDNDDLISGYIVDVG